METLTFLYGYLCKNLHVLCQFFKFHYKYPTFDYLFGYNSCFEGHYYNNLSPEKMFPVETANTTTADNQVNSRVVPGAHTVA